MRILGIETATAVCAAAIADSGSVLAERLTERPHAHSEQLLSLISECLRDAGMDLQSLQGIAVSMGPGSFTGLRIGLSAGKGLAFAGRTPLVGIGTLEALAWAALTSGWVEAGTQVATVIDARRDELYAALYRRTGDALEEILSPRAILVADFAGRLRPGERITLVGDGTEKTARYLGTDLPAMRTSVVIPPPEHRRCSAAAVAILGERRLSRMRGDDLATLEPSYGKEFFTLLQHQHAPVN